MTDREIYETIIGDPDLKEALDDYNFKQLYRLILKKNMYVQGDGNVALTFEDLTVFLKAAGIAIEDEGIAPFRAFSGNKDAATFDFSKVTEIEPFAFQDSGIKKVGLKNNQIVGYGAFKDSDVEQIFIDDGVEVGPAAFGDCRSLKLGFISGGAKLSQMVFANCFNIEEIAFGEGRPGGEAGWPESLFHNVKHIDFLDLPDDISLEDFARVFGNMTFEGIAFNCNRQDAPRDLFIYLQEHREVTKNISFNND